MDSSVYDLFDKVKRFLAVWRKHPGSMFVCYVIIVLVSYVGISLADLTSHNAYDASMLGTTMLSETGPYFLKSVEDHIQFLEEFKGYLEDRHLAGILGFLSDRYNPKKDLDDALANLKKAKASGSEEKTAKAIWQAGDQLVQFQMKAASFPRMKITLQEHPRVTESLLTAVEDAIKQSREALTVFQNNPTLDAGALVCRRNRLAKRRLFLARAVLIRPEDDSQELLESFRKIVVDTIGAEETYATSLSGPEKRMSELFTESEQYRLEILNAVAKGDLQQAYMLQCKAGRKTYHRREELLVLSKTLLEELKKPAS